MILSPGLAPLVHPVAGRVIITRQAETDKVRVALAEFLKPKVNEQQGFRIGSTILDK